MPVAAVEQPQENNPRRLFVALQFCLAVAGLTVGLLSGPTVNAVETAEQSLRSAQATDRNAVPSDAAIIPETRGRPSPELPAVQPGSPPPPSLTVPVPPPSEAAPPLRQGPRFVLRDVDIVGNTVLDPAAIRGVVDPYIGKPVTTGDLEEIRR